MERHTSGVLSIHGTPAPSMYGRPWVAQATENAAKYDRNTTGRGSTPNLTHHSCSGTSRRGPLRPAHFGTVQLRSERLPRSVNRYGSFFARRSSAQLRRVLFGTRFRRALPGAPVLAGAVSFIQGSVTGQVFAWQACCHNLFLTVTRTLRHAADIASSRNRQQVSAKSLQRRWKHDIQVALLRRRAAMTRAVLPNLSARAEWLLAGIIDRARNTGVTSFPLTVDLATTTMQTPRLTQQYQMTTMTSLPSPVNRSHLCTHQASDSLVLLLAEKTASGLTMIFLGGFMSQFVPRRRCARKHPRRPRGVLADVRRNASNGVGDLSALLPGATGSLSFAEVQQTQVRLLPA